MKLLNVSKITEGHKIQLVKDVRELWGAERTQVGRKVAFYQTEKGEVLLRPVE